MEEYPMAFLTEMLELETAFTSTTIMVILFFRQGFIDGFRKRSRVFFNASNIPIAPSQIVSQ